MKSITCSYAVLMSKAEPCRCHQLFCSGRSLVYLLLYTYTLTKVDDGKAKKIVLLVISELQNDLIWSCQVLFCVRRKSEDWHLMYHTHQRPLWPWCERYAINNQNVMCHHDGTRWQGARSWKKYCWAVTKSQPMTSCLMGRQAVGHLLMILSLANTDVAKNMGKDMLADLTCGLLWYLSLMKFRTISRSLLTNCAEDD